MPRVAPGQLTDRAVRAAGDGLHGDGGGLWLAVKGAGRRWTFRFTSPTTGKAREMGLGSYPDTTLVMARSAAQESRRLIAAGIDPIEQKRAQEAERLRGSGPSFGEAAERYVKEQAPAWRDKRRADNWTRSLELHAYPHVGEKAVATIDTDDVLRVLRPIWTVRTETAQKLRGRIERILDYAKIHGWRTGDNPALWRGHLANVLPKPSSIAKVQHHAAVERKDIGKVMARLVESEGVAAKAVRFACLTAARSGEVRNAVWSEIDMEGKTWTVPAEKMKMAREHRVPLSEGALAVLREVRPLRDSERGDLVFPGQKEGRPLTDVALSKALHTAAGTKEVTVHGLRSTFRDWVAEETDYPNEVAEMALAHTIGNKVEAAYRRGDLFEKRREMMADWATICSQPRDHN